MDKNDDDNDIKMKAKINLNLYFDCMTFFKKQNAHHIDITECDYYVRQWKFYEDKLHENKK